MLTLAFGKRNYHDICLKPYFNIIKLRSLEVLDNQLLKEIQPLSLAYFSALVNQKLIYSIFTDIIYYNKKIHNLVIAGVSYENKHRIVKI